MGTEEQWVQRNSGYRGTVSTEEQWIQRNSGHRSEEQLAQSNSGTRGTIGTADKMHFIRGRENNRYSKPRNPC